MIDSTSMSLHDTLLPLTKAGDLIEVCSQAGGGKTRTLIESYAHAVKKLHAETPKGDTPPVALFICAETPREWVITRLATTMLVLNGEEVEASKVSATSVNQLLAEMPEAENIVIIDLSPGERTIKNAIVELEAAFKTYNVAEVFADFGGGWVTPLSESKVMGDPEWMSQDAMVRSALKGFAKENDVKLWFTSQAARGLLMSDPTPVVLANEFSKRRRMYPSVDVGVFITSGVSNWVPNLEGLDVKYETYVL